MTSAKTDSDQPADLAQAAATRKQQWEAENREAIENYNRFVEEHGVFSDGLRAF